MKIMDEFIGDPFKFFNFIDIGNNSTLNGYDIDLWLTTAKFIHLRLFLIKT